MVSHLTPSLSRGVETLKNALAQMSLTSGVYQMRAEDGTILYIGKAKNLKNRVSNYANFSQLPSRLQRMVSLVREVHITETRSEAEALLLEASLIKKEQPRYNILLKDDKSYPYILFTDHEAPRIVRYRGNKQEKGQYFGPFVSVSAVYETLAILQKSFLLRPCSDNIYKHRTRPCLQYQIKRCSAPCVGLISTDDYAKLVKQATRFLQGDAGEIRKELSTEMERASEAMEFERAAQFRDRLRAITNIQRQQSAIPDVVDADVFVLLRENNNVAVYVGSYRHGEYIGHEHYFPTNAQDTSDMDVLSLTIVNYYTRRPVPKLVLINAGEAEDLSSLGEALSMFAKHSISLEHPKRGHKVQALERGLGFAADALKRKLSTDGFDATTWAQLAELLGLENPPERVEIYDNSHTMGTNAIGAMVVATPSGFDKKSYRTFNIKTNLTPGDDFAMMREVLTRRLKGEDMVPPDLLIIDGGAGQLSATLGVMKELGVENIPILSLAKGVDRNAGREWIHMPNREPFQLPHSDARLHLMQRMRDEAHRFAIGTHRNKRSKSAIKSELDAIPNIGPRRKRALLNHFGSVRDIASASIQELQRVDGISAELAEQIHSYFHAS